MMGAVKWEPLPLTAPEPANNPSTPEKIALGARLFADSALSRDGTVACVSCHDTKRGGGADGRQFSRGIGGQLGGRNAPTVFNAAFQAWQFWDGRAHSLEEQALGPIANPVEMGSTDLNAVVERLKADRSYVDAFAAAFGAGEPVSIERVAQAIAAYERTLITPDAPYDRFVRGDQSALTPQQVRGMALFESAGCADCHSGPNFSSASMLAPDRGGTGLQAVPGATLRLRCEIRPDRGFRRAGKGLGARIVARPHAAEHRPDRALLSQRLGQRSHRGCPYHGGRAVGARVERKPRPAARRGLAARRAAHDALPANSNKRGGNCGHHSLPAGADERQACGGGQALNAAGLGRARHSLRLRAPAASILVHSASVTLHPS